MSEYPPRPAVTPKRASDQVSATTSIVAFAWIMAYLTFGIPIAVMLWRLALGAW